MSPLVLKVVGIGLVVALVVGGAFMLRHELIEKGRNLVYAEDNAARVKAQEEQAARDKVLIAAQNDYINQLQNAGNEVKEKIRVVAAPCKDDGRGDPRLGLFNDWLRARPGNSGPANGGRPAAAAVPAAGK